MKWTPKTKKRPYPGELRQVTRFAFIPMRCKEGHKHWLEQVRVSQWWGHHSHTWWDFTECECNDMIVTE